MQGAVTKNRMLVKYGSAFRTINVERRDNNFHSNTVRYSIITFSISPRIFFYTTSVLRIAGKQSTSTPVLSTNFPPRKRHRIGKQNEEKEQRLRTENGSASRESDNHEIPGNPFE